MSLNVDRVATHPGAVLVYFARPVRGADPTSGELFTADRHGVSAEPVRQDRKETFFFDAAGEVIAQRPTPLILRIVWPASDVDLWPKCEREAVTLEERKRRNPSAYDPWTKDEESLLLELDKAGSTVSEISVRLGRSHGAITSRLERLGRR